MFRSKEVGIFCLREARRPMNSNCSSRKKKNPIRWIFKRSKSLKRSSPKRKKGCLAFSRPLRTSSKENRHLRPETLWWTKALQNYKRNQIQISSRYSSHKINTREKSISRLIKLPLARSILILCRLRRTSIASSFTRLIQKTSIKRRKSPWAATWISYACKLWSTEKRNLLFLLKIDKNTCLRGILHQNIKNPNKWQEK